MRSTLVVSVVVALGSMPAGAQQLPSGVVAPPPSPIALERQAGASDRVAALTPLPVGATAYGGAVAGPRSGAGGDPAISRDDALIATLFVFGVIAVAPVDRYFAERLQRPWSQESRVLRIPAETLNYIAMPGSIIIGSGLFAYGWARNDRETAALGLHGLEAILIGSGLAGIIKGTAGRARPYLDVNDPLNFELGRGFANERYRSFPSGHTVAGFAAAVVVTSETSRWWPGSENYIAPVMYVGATLIGLSRMYTNFHWASDVVMGAAIGTFAGVLINRYHRTHPDNWFDNALLPDEGRGNPTASLAPYYIVLWSAPLPR